MSHPSTATKYEDEEMMMQLDEDMDAEGEDQLIDDETLSPAARPGSGHTPSAHQLTLDSRNNLNARRRNAPVGVQGAIDKSARKREQREREKEQQKLLLAKLIEIFEAGGGTCAVQQGQKKFPWVDLPAALIRIGCYFAGWPEKCLPKMSDKHPDRIDASTGPSQWSLKQKRAMEAQITKGAVKVLPRPAHRAVIFEVVDDFGNVKDSTVEFSENWVRNKLLGHAMVANSPPAPHAVPHANYPPEARQMPSSMTPDVDYSPPNRSLALPPIRSNPDYSERLDLPSLSKSLSGLHTPEDGSRSPSPMSNFSEGRYHSASVHPSFRHSYYGPGKFPSGSQDDLFPTRGRMLSLEHGLPRTAASLRSTSRPKSNYTLHHHPYSHAMASSSVSSIRSRPPSPLSVHNHSHSRSHSGVGPAPLNTSDAVSTYGIAPPRSATSNGASPSLASASGQQRFPSHIPNIPSSVVTWDAHSRGWILKFQNESGFRSLPCQGNGLVYWHRDLDEWECRSAHQEVGKAMWNPQIARWYLLLPPEEEVETLLASPQFVRHAVFPTHVPLLDGECTYDSEHLRAWVFTPSPEAESQLPISPCTIVWSVNRKQWSLIPQSAQEADVSWSPEDRSWHFNMQGFSKGSRSASPRPSSAPHSNVLPPMIIPPSSPIQSIKSPRSSAMRPISTASSSF